MATTGRWAGYVKTQKKCSNPNCEILVWKGTYCNKCYQRLYRHGSIDTILSKHRTYFFNEKFMDEWTKESAWTLGWILSDGGIHDKNGYGLHIELKDKEPLEIIKKLFSFEGEIKETSYYKDKTSTDGKYWKLNLHSKYLINRLKQLEITTNKSLTVKMPKIPTEYFPHFLRGLIEGDGSIVKNKKDNRLYIFINSGNKDFIEELRSTIPFYSSLIIQTKERKNPLYRLAFTSKNAQDLADYIYKDSAGIRLTRKFLKYQEYLSLKDKHYLIDTSPA